MKLGVPRVPMSVGLVVVFASASFGQNTPAIEASLGYSFLRERPQLNRHGWVGSVAGNINNWLGVEGEIGGSYTDIVHRDAHSFLAGAQFTARRHPTVTPWAHFLVGVVRTGRGVSIVNIGDVIIRAAPPAFLGTTGTDFAIQPGGGVDFWLNPTFGIRVGADYRHRFAASFVSQDAYRVQAGIVLRTKPK